MFGSGNCNYLLGLWLGLDVFFDTNISVRVRVRVWIRVRVSVRVGVRVRVRTSHLRLSSLQEWLKKASTCINGIVTQAQFTQTPFHQLPH